ncbi:VOC family protein [Lysobacter sp. 2RAF19]
MMQSSNAIISVMLAVPSAAEATAWYRRALGAEVSWDLGSVVGLTIAGAPVFLASALLQMSSRDNNSGP